MGACCGKGSQPKDPDKSPYAPSSSPQKDKKGKSKKNEIKQKSNEPAKIEDTLEDLAEKEPRNGNIKDGIDDIHEKVSDKVPDEHGKSSEEHKRSKSDSSSSGGEDSEKGKQDSAQTEKQPEEINVHEKKSETEVDPDQSLNTTGTDEVDVPEVELHIDESKLESSPEIKPTITTATSLAAPASLKTKEDVESKKKDEVVPDPNSIIENVRNKSKEGGYNNLSVTSAQSDEIISNNVTYTTVTTKKVQNINEPIPEKVSTIIESDVSKPKDVNQNDSMAILSALKLIRENGGEASLQKEEVKTTIEEIKSNDKSGESYVTEVKVEKSTKVITSEGSKIPISPVRKEAVIVDSEWKQKANKEIESSTSRARKTSAPLHPPPIVEVEAKKETLPEHVAKSKEEENINESDTARNGHMSPKVSFAENVTLSVSSESSLSDTSPIEDGPVLLQNKKSSIMDILPNFRGANADVMSRYEFCTNTRISTLRTIDQWIEGELPGDGNHSRTMVLKSPLGMGKSALLKHVCSKYGLQLAAYHFFCHNTGNLSHNYFRDVILYMIFLFLEKFENYMACLPSMEKVEDVLMCGTIEEILDMFIYKALSSEDLDHDIDRKMIVVLDALDECSVPDRDSLFQFVDTFNSRLPSWFYLLVSIRDENQLMNKLNDVFVVELKHNNENMTDMKRIMKETLGNFMDRISLDGGLTQLAKKTNGVVLCASLYNRMLQNMNNDKKIALREIDAKFPTGINGILEKVFSRTKELLEAEADLKQKYNVLLGVLCYAREPIHESIFEAVGLKGAQSVKDALSTVIKTVDESSVLIYHKAIAEWLLNEKISSDLHLDTGIAKAAYARFCMDWVEPVFNQTTVTSPLSKYALKHSVSHIIDITKQQENVGKVLCNLRAIEALIKLKDVNINDALKLYSHNHSQLGEAQKYVSVENYLKKFPKIIEQITLVKNFLIDNKVELLFSPGILYQIAANYPKNERLQHNARVELGNQPWLEDLSIISETKGICKVLPGCVCAVDVSSDGKSVAVVVKDDQYEIHLLQYNVSNGDEKSQALNIKAMDGRTGLCCNYMNDNTNIFVGSLTTFVNSKGKVIPSGIDTSTIKIKEKYSIESSDVSMKYLAVSLTTFPWGGRSVHLGLINIKDKKCIKTLEVLQYRFGGSANFGIRCCAISSDEKLLTACIKDTNKNQLKVNIWGIGKWDVLHTVTVTGDSILKCHFVEQNGLLMDIKEKDGKSFCAHWTYNSSNVVSNIGVHNNTNTSTISTTDTLCISWRRNKQNAQITVWSRGEHITEETGSKYRLDGVSKTEKILLTHSNIISVEDNVLKIFAINELQHIDGVAPKLSDLCLSDLGFMPRSDTSVFANIDDDNHISVFNCDTLTDDVMLKQLNFPSQLELKMEKRPTLAKVFQGANLSSQTCHVSSDSNYLVINLGCGVSIWNISDETLVPLSVKGVQKVEVASVLLCLASPKEPFASVVHQHSPNTVKIYDLKSKQEVRQLCIDENVDKSNVTDMIFMPHSGYLVTYHKNSNKLVVWNTRLGKQVSSESKKLNFCRPSISSDRLLLSFNESTGGHLLLRNSDGKFNTKLNVPDEWSCRKGELNMDFSPDGTIVIGVETLVAGCRIWNAGNGEVLKNLDVKFKGLPSIVGMLTNTHVALYDDRIQIIDIATGESICITPIPQEDEGSQEIKQLIISPRGNIIAGCSNEGNILMWKCHNFSAVKRKTTLQRIKSFSSP